MRPESTTVPFLFVDKVLQCLGSSLKQSEDTHRHGVQMGLVILQMLGNLSTIDNIEGVGTIWGQLGVNIHCLTNSAHHSSHQQASVFVYPNAPLWPPVPDGL